MISAYVQRAREKVRQPTRADIETLVARIEAAPVERREMADDILRACGWVDIEDEGGLRYWCLLGRHDDRFDRVFVAKSRPDPLADLNEAVELIPPGCMTTLFLRDTAALAQVNDLADGRYGCMLGKGHVDRGPHLARALVVAALRARAARMPA